MWQAPVSQKPPFMVEDLTQDEVDDNDVMGDSPEGDEVSGSDLECSVPELGDGRLRLEHECRGRGGALGGGLTAALGAGLLLPGSSSSGGGGLPLSASVGRSWPDFLAWLVAAAWHIATSSPRGGHRLRSFAGWLLLAQLFYVRRRGPLLSASRSGSCWLALLSGHWLLLTRHGPRWAEHLGWAGLAPCLWTSGALAWPAWVLCTLWRVLSV